MLQLQTLKGCCDTLYSLQDLYRVELLHREIPAICTGKGFAVKYFEAFASIGNVNPMRRAFWGPTKSLQSPNCLHMGFRQFFSNKPKLQYLEITLSIGWSMAQERREMGSCYTAATSTTYSQLVLSTSASWLAFLKVCCFLVFNLF